jgi:protein-disulfide isomerase
MGGAVRPPARLRWARRVPRRPCPEDPTLTRRPAPPPAQSRKERRRTERDTRRQRETRVAGRPAWQSPAVLVTIAAVAVGLVIVAAIALTQGGGNTNALVPPPEAIPTGIPVDGETLGRADAPVTLTIYSDFQCPSCDLFATQTEPRLRTTFVQQGLLKIVYHDAAFQGAKGSDPNYDESVEPAAAARCAGVQGKFWQFHDWLFANQHGENACAFTRDRLTAIAEKIDGLDVAAWTTCLDSGAQQTIVKTQTQETIQKKINSTPTLDLNGQQIVGAAPYDQLATAIQAAAASPSASGASPSASGASPSASGPAPSASGSSPSP